MPIVVEDDIISTLTISDNAVSAVFEPSTYTLEIALPGHDVFIVDIPPENLSILEIQNDNAIVIPEKSISVVTIAEQGPVGPVGPQGPAGVGGVDIDKMINPDYPDTIMTTIGDPISSIEIRTQGDDLIFLKTITYNLDGDVVETSITDMVNNNRVTNTFTYTVGGIIKNRVYESL